MKKFNLLTRTAVRKLAPKKRLTEHGITFERLADGDGVYSINIMVDGQRVHRVVGRESDGVTRSQAEEFIAKVRRDALENRLALPKGRKTALSFRLAANRYLEKLEEEGGKDIGMKRSRLVLHLVPFFGDTPLSKITSFDIERYKKSRLGQPASRGKNKRGEHTYVGMTKPGTVNRELATLSHLISKAVEWEWIPPSSVRIRRCKESQGRIAYLTTEQARKLIECAKSDRNPLVYPFIKIGLGTAMRRMEILCIRRENVHLDRKVIFIPHAKAGAREQPITQDLVNYLTDYIKALPDDQPWLFPSKNAEEGHATDIRKPFRRVVVAAGMDPDVVVRHTLRHTAITHLVQAGVDLPTVKRISGHKTLSMVERYAHQNGEHIRSAMDKLEAQYKNEVKEPEQVYLAKAA